MAEQLQLFCGKKLVSWQIISFAIYTTLLISPDIERIVGLSINLTSIMPPLHRYQRLRLLYLTPNRWNPSKFRTEDYAKSYTDEGYLQAAQVALCKYPYDKIYSILGLCSPLACTIMHPNYDWPVQRLYSQVVKSFAEGIGSLDLLV
jgi:hypothetical protein